MRILLTGAEGFLGWHTQVRLRALTGHEVVPVGRAAWGRLSDLVRGADAIIHLAGVNRAAPEHVEQGNVQLAQDVARAVRGSGGSPRIVFANSIQAGNDTAYGIGKATAGRLLAAAAAEVGAGYVDVRLPNLFGEHGRPNYNSFVPTFVEAVVAGVAPTVQDREVSLLHAQDAAQALIDGLTGPAGSQQPAGTPTRVQQVLNRLIGYWNLYREGDVPALDDALDVNLFNTLRFAVFPAHYPIALATHADDRGRLVETVRSHGGQGQTFVSTTRPGVTRGDHFHLSKIERFVVLSGRARISLRKVLTDEVVSFDVDGDAPAVVDMPTMWVHNLTNIGDTELIALFWTHTLFDPEAPDTYREKVSLDGVSGGS